MYADSNMETYITMCKIDSQWEFAVCFRKLKQGLCINLERWDEEGMGGRLKREGIYVYLWMGKQWKQCQTLFWGAPKSLQMVTAAMKLKDTYSLEEKL